MRVLSKSRNPKLPHHPSPLLPCLFCMSKPGRKFCPSCRCTSGFDAFKGVKESFERLMWCPKCAQQPESSKCLGLIPGACPSISLKHPFRRDQQGKPVVCKHTHVGLCILYFPRARMLGYLSVRFAPLIDCF